MVFVDIGIQNSQKFLSDDIKNDKIFIKSLSTFAYAWDRFSNLRNAYIKGQSVEQKINLAATLKTIEQMVKNIKENVDKITSLKINHSQPAIVLSQTYLKCPENIRNLMCAIVNLTNKVQDTYLLANLKRQITQHLNLAKKLFIQQDDEMFELFVKTILT